MDVVEHVGHHVISSKGRCDDTVYNNVLFVGDDGVDTLAVNNFDRGYLLLSADSLNAVTDSHLGGIH